MSQCQHPVTHTEPNGEVTCLVCDKILTPATQPTEPE